MPVTPDELKSLIYIPVEYEWPSCGRDEECDRILAGLERIMELSIAEYFNYPVDLVKKTKLNPNNDILKKFLLENNGKKKN